MNASTVHLPAERLLLPRNEDGLGAGALMALVVHVGLILALALGVSWHASEPEGVTAELWAAVPQAAAPPAAEPPPEPAPAKPAPREVRETPPPPQVQREADIAIEKERTKQKKLREQEQAREHERQLKEKAEREKAEKEKALKEKAEKDKLAKTKADAEADKRKKQEEDAKLAKLREENLKRLMGQVGGQGAPTSSGTAARDAGPSASYAGRIKARIKPNIVLTDEVAGNPVAEVELRVAPDGTIIGRRIAKSSGVKEWDDTVLRAVDRTEVLPRDVDGRVPPTMLIAFRPKD